MTDLNHVQLLKSKMKELNLERSDVVNRMGYENRSKGFRVFDDMKKGELPKGGQIDLLASALNLDKETMNKSIENSEELLQERKDDIRREKFKPFLCSIGERSIPSPIFIGILVNNQRYVHYEDDFLEMDERKQVEQVKKDVVEHYEKTEGGILPFGKTTHYIFKRRFEDEKEDVLVFDVNGNQITENLEDYRRSAGGGKLSVSGKELRVSVE